MALQLGGADLRALSINSVSKSFGPVRAVQNVSVEIEAGKIQGILGPNGSGKSTALKMALGILKPDSGSIKVYGVDVQQSPIEAKRMIGYVPESPRLYEFLTGVEYLDFIGDVHGLDVETKKSRITEFLEAFELEGRENEMISGYSQGMKQKIAIIAAFLHRPKLLVFDEPLNGLDPKSARIVKDLIHKLARDGVTTIFSTHILEIAEAICDAITIMYEGRILAEGTMQELRSQAGMPGSTLEDVFMKVTGTNDVRSIVEALAR